MLNRYDVLSQDDLESIHQASLEVLGKTGMEVDHPLAQEKLAEAGAEVDFKTGRIRFPAHLVEAALKKAPGEFLCAGRDESFDFNISWKSDPPVARAAGGAIEYLDPVTNKTHPMGIQDCIDYARLVDSFSHVDILGTPTPMDLPPETYDIHTLKHLLENNRKHMWVLTTDSKNLKFQLEMMKAVAGGADALKKRPVCSGIVCIIDPFFMPHDEVERLMLYGEYNIPLRVPIVPMIGTTAPFTIAGAVVEANAEYLGALTIIQTLTPGTPVIYYVIPKSMDMVTGIAISASSTETVLLSSAIAQLARRYQVPSAISTASGTCSQSHQLMFQYGNSILMGLLSGASEVSVLGHVGGAIMCSPTMAVICDEIIGYYRCMMKGFEVNKETLALEAMERVGPRGQFLSDPHTMQFLRKEPRFRPDLFQWNTHAQWEQSDFKTLIQRAQEKVSSILKNHEVPPLDKAVRKELDVIAKAADKALLS